MSEKENKDLNPEANDGIIGRSDSGRGNYDACEDSTGSQKTEMGCLYRFPCSEPQKSKTL